MFAMTVYKCTTTLFTHGAGRLPIITLFLRDGVFWFVAIFGVQLCAFPVIRSNCIFIAIFLPEIVIWARARASLAEIMIASVHFLSLTVAII